MSICTCKKCGKEFESKHLAAFCSDCKVGVCVICGKEFTRTADYPDKVCCCRKCSIEYRKQNGDFKKQSEQARATRLERYGTLRSDIFKEYTRNCKYCGKEFVTKSPKKMYCDGPHYGPCPICGGPSLVTDLTSFEVPTCSEKCRQEKIRRTNQENLGVNCVFQSKVIQEKSRATMLEKYGVEHYSQTEEFKAMMSEVQPQKYRESEDKRKQTNISKYGTPYPTMNESVKAKSRATVEEHYGGFGWASEELNFRIQETNLLRYGVLNPMQNSEIRDKYYHSMVEKYGETPFRNPEIREKKKQTSLERYGTTSPSQSEEVKLKVKDTSRFRYGVDNPFQSEEVKKKIAASNMDRYGVSNPMQNEDIRNKSYETNLLKYGRKHFKGSDIDLLRSSFDSNKLEVYKKFRDYTEEFLRSYESPPTIKQLIDDTGTNATTVSYIVVKNNLQHLISYIHTPYLEQDIVDFLKEYLDESEITLHNRAVITPKEIDIFLPNFNLGIECNPTYTHNSSKGTHFIDQVLPYNYHQQKTIDCEKQHVRLVHLFGYQWNNRPEVVKSMILNLIGKTPIVYYARELEVRSVSDTDSHMFLHENHIQGYTSSKVRLGLYDSNELVALMTFSRKRGTMGHRSTDTESDWELTRFCNKLYSRCVGGASKLFKYFVDHYHPSSVISFSDRSNTSGGLYSVLGFKLDSYTGVGYVWVDSKTDAYYNRVACQKNKLRKLFNDPLIDIENKTEAEIMEEHGFVKVCNSGLIKWVWKASLV